MRRRHYQDEASGTGDSRRWPDVWWKIRDGAVSRTGLDELLAIAGIVDADLRAVVSPQFIAWQKAPVLGDDEEEAVLVNTLDATIDEQDRRGAAR